MTEPKPMSRAELEQKIVALAWKDEAFRKAFLADPKGQFEKRLGTTLPAGLTIAAHAEDENHLYFVIPAKPKNAREMSDADLESVAGGVKVNPDVTVVLSTITTLGTLGTAFVVNASVRAIGGKDAAWE